MDDEITALDIWREILELYRKLTEKLMEFDRMVRKK